MHNLKVSLQGEKKAATLAPLMKTMKQFIDHLYLEKGLDSASKRRELLIAEMEQLEGIKVHCFSCPGTCCTSQANSMQVTPIEALEVLASLNVDSMSSEELAELKANLTQTVNDFRLNVELFTGRKSSSELRRSYTCPFFKREARGCALSRSAKPYGCLGFNPKDQDDNGKTCTSNIPLLTSREDSYLHQELQTNTYLKETFKLYWNKKNLPQALLELLPHFTQK